MRKLLTPAFGTYVGWAILQIVSLVGSLTLGNRFIQKIPFIGPLTRIGGAILGHIGSRMKGFSSWLFEKKERKTIKIIVYPFLHYQSFCNVFISLVNRRFGCIGNYKITTSRTLNFQN